MLLSLSVPGFREKEVLDEPLKVLAAAGIDCGENIFRSQVFDGVPDMFLQPCQIGRFQGIEIGIADVRGFVVNQTAHHAEQGFIAVQGQTRKLNDIAVGKRIVTADAYLHPVFAAQDKGKQGQRFNDVLIIHGLLQKKKTSGDGIPEVLNVEYVLWLSFGYTTTQVVDYCLKASFFFVEPLEYSAVQPFCVRVQTVPIDIQKDVADGKGPPGLLPSTKGWLISRLSMRAAASSIMSA